MRAKSDTWGTLTFKGWVGKKKRVLNEKRSRKNAQGYRRKSEQTHGELNYPKSTLHMNSWVKCPRTVEVYPM